MLYLRSWLEEYIDLEGVQDSDLSNLISIKSGEVEEYKEITDWFDGKVLIGRIENIKNHPNADRLKIFDVNLGHKGKIQIVSAASNVVEGLLVPTATIGTKLAYLTISERQMRGEKSEGMCMGKSELMLETDYSSGLWELNTEIPEAFQEQVLGMSICEVLPEYFPSQVVYDIKYLPDKVGHLGCHLALAIELDLILDGASRLKNKAKRLLDLDLFWNEFQNSALKIKQNFSKKATFEDNSDYTNIFSLFELNLKNEFNLDIELQQRMFFTSKNLIGGLADLSNYLLYDVGQPSHFFVDKGEFSWNWKVQNLENPTEFEGLGKLTKTELKSDIRVIQDGQQSVWIPGITGSEKTKVVAEDKNICIELANFSLEAVARNSFKLNYRSESCRFWNSGVSIPAFLVWILHFIENLEKNNLEFEFLVFLNWLNPNHELSKYEQNNEGFLGFCHRLLEVKNLTQIELDAEYISGRIDPNFSPESVQTYIQKLGILDGNKLTPNIFYNSLKTPEDVLFEVVRLHGLDNISHQELPAITNQSFNSEFNNILALKELIISFGFNEVITRPLVDSKNLLSSLTNNQEVALEAISTQRQNENKLRDSLFPSLMTTSSINLSRGEKQLQIFELDKIYTFSDSKLNEKLELGLILESSEPYILTTLISKIAKFTKSKNLAFDKLEDELGNGYLYTLDSGIKVKLVQIANKFKKSYEINLSKSLWYLELDLVNWNLSTWKYRVYKDETDFPVVSRNYSWFVSKNDNWDKIQTLILETEISEAQVQTYPVERFSSEEDKDVVNLELQFVGSNRTLTSEEIADWEKDLFKKLSIELTHFLPR